MHTLAAILTAIRRIFAITLFGVAVYYFVSMIYGENLSGINLNKKVDPAIQDLTR